jgi:2-oxoglutarate dehydrogenase E2 component (dihydrolipoamide succinyltransferase)
MPQLGETVTEGTVTKWMKKVGDPVAIDEILFEVSTDKVDSEVPSTASGFLTEILVQEGETVDVGTTLAVIGQSSDASGGSPAVDAPPVAQTPPPPPPVAQTPPPPPPVAQTPPPPTPATEIQAEAASFGVPDAPSQPSSNGYGSEMVAGEFDGVLLSPVVRKLLRENGVQPSQVTGTGAGGRITRSDVLNFLDSQRVGQVRSTAPAGEQRTLTSVSEEIAVPQPSAHVGQASPPLRAESVPSQREMVAHSSPSVVAGPRDEVIPFTNIRRRTAEHMVRSKATSAHTLAAIEVDFEPVERVRHLLRERFKADEGFSLTYLPFIARATVEALRTYPRINSSVGDDELVVHKDVHLSIAVDLDLDGLIAPVVHNADTKRLTGLAREIRDLADRARTKKLTADDIAGGTFTITNPGPFGTFITAPIINQPQVAILSTDGIKRKPVVVTHVDGSESIAIHSVGVLALSFDHRVIDGAYAAAFLARMREIIETWNWAQEF